MIRIMSLLLLVLASLPASYAGVKCPEMSVILKGTSNVMGTTFNETVVLEKERGGGSGVNGPWKITQYTGVHTYGHNVGNLNIPQSQIDLGHGISMVCDAVVSGNRVTVTCDGGTAYLDVVNRKVGFINTNEWIGEIQGDTMTVKFDKGSPVESHKTGTIRKFTGGELDLNITEPQQNSKHLFSQATPGILQMTFKAEVKPANLKNKIRWTLPQIEGSTRTISPATAMGPEVTVTYKGLPAKNSEFGSREVKADIDAEVCEASDTKNVSLFFPRDVNNNPGGVEPNWFYYWSQTSARQGPAKYGARNLECSGISGNTDKTLGYYASKYMPDHYFICDLSKLGSDFRHNANAYDWATQLFIPSGQVVTGIDSFGKASAHENAHYTHYKDWWFQFKGQTQIQIALLKGPLDKDKDDMLDSAEPSLGFDPTKYMTYPQTNEDDEEIHARLKESDWPVGSADKEDWAKPGKQWTGN